MYNGMCFEAQLYLHRVWPSVTESSMQILGFDVMLDQKLQPWLLEACFCRDCFEGFYRCQFL